MIAAYSGGPTISARAAKGAATRISTRSLKRSPRVEAQSAMCSAFFDLPALVSWWPSMAVKVADGVPGMLSSTAGTLPPKLPALADGNQRHDGDHRVQVIGEGNQQPDGDAGIEPRQRPEDQAHSHADAGEEEVLGR